MVARHLQHSSNLLITILIGNMFVNIFSTSLSERLATDLFHGAGLEISIFSMTFLIIIFGEITPKVVAVNYAEHISVFVIPFVHTLYSIVTPLRKVLYHLSDIFIKLLSRFFSTDVHSSYEEISSIVMDSHKYGLIYKHEKQMIEGILKLNTLRARDIMTPRTELIALEVNEPLTKIYNKIQRGKYSRIPVYEKHLDNLIGLLYTKDFLMLHKTEASMRTMLRKPHFVPETKIAVDLFRDMRQLCVHIAIVVDEYGGVAGIISMEDILEEIFGDILDKKDVLLTLKKVSPHAMKISGRLSIEDFNEIFKANIVDDQNVTIGGYLLSHFGHIPQKGECIVAGDIEFMVTRSKKNRIEDIMVTRRGKHS